MRSASRQVGGEVTEKRMFGGLAFMVDGNLAVAASRRGGLLVRTDPADADEMRRCPGSSRWRSEDAIRCRASSSSPPSAPHHRGRPRRLDRALPRLRHHPAPKCLLRPGRASSAATPQSRPPANARGCSRAKRAIDIRATPAGTETKVRTRGSIREKEDGRLAVSLEPPSAWEAAGTGRGDGVRAGLNQPRMRPD